MGKGGDKMDGKKSRCILNTPQKCDPAMSETFLDAVLKEKKNLIRETKGREKMCSLDLFLGRTVGVVIIGVIWQSTLNSG